MAPVQPAAWLENRNDHTAQTYRLALAGLASGGAIQGSTVPAGGVHPAFGNRLNVTGTADMHVSVDTGLVYMPSSIAWGGFYAGYNNGAYLVGPLASSSTTQFRSDLIVARQHDSVNGDPDDNWDIIAVTGVFSNTLPAPVPNPPNNAIPLGVVNVTPNMTATNGAGAISDARLYMPLSGPIYTTSINKPSTSAPEGTQWFETDKNRLGIIINNGYSYVAVAPDDAWFPPISAVKPADTQRSNTTNITSDPDLSISLKANCTYMVDALIIYDGGAGASESDIQWTFGLPSGAGGGYADTHIPIAGGFGWPNWSNWTDVRNNGAQTQGVGTSLVIQIHGIYVGGNSSGSLTFKWGPNANKSTNTHVKQNSILSARRVA